MGNKDGIEKATGKGKKEKKPVVAFPVLFPFFSIGALILPLIIPVPRPLEPPKK